MHGLTITKRLTLYFLLMGLLIIAIIGSYSYVKAREALMQRTFHQLISLRMEKKNRIENFFQQRYNDLNNISHLNDSKEIAGLIRNDSNPERTAASNIFNHYSGTYLQALGIYSHAYYLHKDGYGFVFQTDRAKSEAAFIRPESVDHLRNWLRDHDSILPGILEYHEFPQIETAGFLLAQKISDTECYLILNIPVSNINHIMIENNMHNGLGETGESYLVGRDQLMRSSSRFQANSAFNTRVETTAVELALQGNTGTGQVKDYRNIDVLSAYCPVEIPGLDWVMLTEIDKREAMIPINNVRSNILYLSVILSLLVFGLAALLSSIITSPIRSLRAETEKITRGQYGSQVQIQRDDEIGDLIKAFNSMSLELKENAQKLEKEKLLRLSSMIDGQEMERQRLSREIHDSLGQSILAIKLKVDQLLKPATTIPTETTTEIRQLFSTALNDIRAISKDLMPAVLSEFGLAEAIANLASDSMKASGIEIDFNDTNFAAETDKKTENYLYRICQEAINNIIKHSGAESAHIVLMADNENIKLTIKDNGRGFDAKHIKNSGHGLTHMKERAELLGGSFLLQSQQNKGTEIEIIIPIKRSKS
ncbi:MAG: HAMP domain-containing protein [Bacteroidetes bacterium]|nr:HAMP domain-containing protein [Bacteroidota bacterium]MBU1578993.1 HAMP domain-containing protein [Bacteroidota bacterium]MBU2466350.1 HAMP domain-containing protein [Bacteroidota bacterium]MBU2558653.1 HAMP domain-containing protein [Bacteroidota bacterium]